MQNDRLLQFLLRINDFLLIYFLFCIKRRERQRQLIYILIHFLNTSNSYDWTRWEPGAQNPIWIQPLIRYKGHKYLSRHLLLLKVCYQQKARLTVQELGFESGTPRCRIWVSQLVDQIVFLKLNPQINTLVAFGKGCLLAGRVIRFR